ncbi:hypothetical protein C7212DRAFT_362149 [Tuber magnatum]|uniref:HAT C-terminal dimerisation domain-containing protein n=1 Tax=Tuber magnatum TaxID=42249 RepID=A0A317T164_9PEZI|nr:hypothetical protein C7212DRAFT_362149 [Tuber magnatum]
MVTKENGILTPFNPQEAKLRPLFLVNVITNTFTNLFEQPPNSDQLIASFLDYYLHRGDFSEDFGTIVSSLKEVSKKDEKEDDPTYIWRLVPDSASDLRLLALRLFTVCPNSASYERVFSSFGIIHLKLKNPLSFEKVAAIAKNFQVSEQPALEDFILSSEEFEAEAVAWMADLTSDAPSELNTPEYPPHHIHLKLSVLFNQSSNFDYDPAVFGELPMRFEEEEQFLEEIVNGLSEEGGGYLPERRNIAQALTGNCFFEPIEQAIATTTSASQT